MNKYLTIISFLFLAACTQPQTGLRNKIAKAEAEFKADSLAVVPDKVKANELIKLYVSYADQFQDDSSSGTYLYRAGQVAYRMRQPQEALGFFSMMQRYQMNSKVSTALFMMGFINDADLGNKEAARKNYQEFLKKYPNHEMANDVQASLLNLDKTDEELIKMFEEKQKEQESQATK